MEYTKKDYEKDMHSPEMLHIQDPERYAAFYEERGKHMEQYRVRPNGRVIKFVQPVGETILDLGCNVGRYAIHYAKEGFEVVGVDISSTVLKEAERKTAKLPKKVADRIKYIHSDIMDLKDLGTFDTIILTEILEHVIDPLAVLKKCATEFMKPTSRIFITTPAERIGIYEHVRGVPQDWLREAGEKVELKFKFSDYIYYPKIHNKQKTVKTRAIGRLK